MVKVTFAIMPNRDNCCVPLCQNNRSKKQFIISFHQFPKDKALKRQWIINIRRDEGKTFEVKQFYFDFS